MKQAIASLLLAGCAISVDAQSNANDSPLAGAWHMQQDGFEQTVVLVDGYLSHSVYDLKNKTFISTRGGTYTENGTQLEVTWQYDTEKAASNEPVAEWLGQPTTFDYRIDDKLATNISGEPMVWTRIDANEGPMAGVWRITGRKQDDNIGQIPLGDRRTLKILTGTRFQWVAINIKTGEFSGTGGGTYTFEDGKYTEQIAFFSRDGSRVGASLTFDGKLEDGAWHHSGLSSKGDPIYEIWNKLTATNE